MHFDAIQVLQSTIYDVDLDRILQSIHLYLQDLGMEEIRRRYIAIAIVVASSYFYLTKIIFIKCLNLTGPVLMTNPCEW